MGRPATVVSEILAVLEPYLESRLVEYSMQHEPREPTLPATADGKVNVRAVTLAIGLRLSQEQHFYKHVELAQLLNAAAEAQGLTPIGSRAQQNDDDEAAWKAIKKAKGVASDYARALAEREALIQRQRARIAELEEQLRIREETGMVIRTAPLH